LYLGMKFRIIPIGFVLSRRPDCKRRRENAPPGGGITAE
jgi:hypothetical protein